MNTATERQNIGCGFEPPVAGARVWLHPGYVGPVVDGVEVMPQVCPGYTCKLPDVIEVSRVRALAKLGAFEAACGGQPTDGMMDAVLLLDAECNALEAWTLTPASKGGGRAD